jgi:hypothetical protein
MKTRKTLTRNQAMIWWDTLPVFGIPSKEYYIGLYYSDDNVTPERIEEIWIKETQTICDESPKEFLKNNPKPNQKQSLANEIIELVGEDNFKQIIKESDKRVNQKQYSEETFGLASETTTREQAIAYFNSLPSVDQQMLTDRYFNERHKQSLTGREIEEIWLKETGGELATGGEKVLEILNSKPNAKEFKQFDESLFRTYIDKLPESESLNMIKIIYENKLPDCKFKAHLDKWFKL